MPGGPTQALLQAPLNFGPNAQSPLAAAAMAGIEKGLSTVKKKSVAQAAGRKIDNSIWSPGDGMGGERIEDGVR